MPALIDHESRRHQIARIAADIIARVGLEPLTMRQIAKEAGFSTTIVTHYFANKRELLLYTYRASVANTGERVEAALQSDPCDLQGCVESLLPGDEASLRDWKVYFAFWQMALVDAEFAAEQRGQVANARSILLRVLNARARAGLNRGANLDGVARRLVVVIQGIAIHSIFDPVDWSADGQRAFLNGELQALEAAG